MQTIGFTDNETAVLSIIFSLGLAGGMVAGGILGDAFAKHFSRYGWPFVNQCSIAVTAPLVALFFKGLPGQPLRISGTSTICSPPFTATAASTLFLCSAVSHPRYLGHALQQSQFPQSTRWSHACSLIRLSLIQ